MTEPEPEVETWDAGQMGCGELIMHLNKRIKGLPPGRQLRVIALDSGAVEDLPAWCKMTGHRLCDQQHPVYLIEKR